MIPYKLTLKYLLREYDEKDYILRRRAKFLFYFVVSAIIVAVLIFMLIAYRQVFEFGYLKTTILPIPIIIICFLWSFIALIKGQFSTSARVLLLSSMAGIWIIVFIDNDRLLYVIDTIVFIFAALSMLPLLSRSKQSILLYGVANIVVFFLFVMYLYFRMEEFRISVHEIREVTIDLSVAMIFSVIAHYNVFSINHLALVNARSELEERIKAERELSESEEMNRVLIKSIPDIIMQSDLEGNIIYANEALQTITGITPAHYSDKNRKSRIHPDDLPMVVSKIRELLSSGASHSDVIENRFLDMEGNIHWFSGTISKISVNGKTVLQTISRDISEKKQTEQELEMYRKKLEKLVKEKTEKLENANEELSATNEELYYKNEIIHNQNTELKSTLQYLQETQSQLVQSEKMASLGTLTAGVAHEINNPLNYLMGASEGLQNYFNEYGSSDPKTTEILLSSIQAGIERVADIVKGLNQFSRNTAILNEDCDIHSIIDNCLAMLFNRIKHKAQIVKEYHPLPIIIKGNVGKLHQVFINILINAVQAIPEMGTIHLNTILTQHYAHVEIIDDGIGIEKKNLSQITDPFFTTKPPGEGTGLGLSITYSIIQEHNGSIHFESELGVGTKVIIKLPFTS